MFRQILATVIAVGVLAACSTQLGVVNDYVVDNKSTRVPAEIPAFKITALDGYESPKRPGHILVTLPSGRMAALIFSGANSQWAASLPTTEPVYRQAALDVLMKRGREGCELGEALPLPESTSIEFAYTCKH